MLAWLLPERFAILHPMTMRFNDAELGLFDLPAALAACRTVVTDDPGQVTLLGFCDPGAAVIELGVDGWFSVAAASCCRMFGLEWPLVLPPPPRYDVLGHTAAGGGSMLHNRIDMAGLPRRFRVSARVDLDYRGAGG